MTDIIDISHNNGDVDFAQLKQQGVIAVIAKATQGASFADPKYAAFRRAAADNGMLWGAYHFGTREPVAGQLANFMTHAALRDGDLACLDFEENPDRANTMDLVQAKDFVRLFRAANPQRGHPVLYAGAWLKQSLAGVPDSELANCPLWLAEYAAQAVLPPGWSRYALWQYVAGSASDSYARRFDTSRFDGTPDELRLAWPGFLNARRSWPATAS